MSAADDRSRWVPQPRAAGISYEQLCVQLLASAALDHGKEH